MAAWRRKNPKSSTRIQLAARLRDPAKYLLQSAAKRARRSGVKFEIDATDLLPLPEFCPVLGTRLRYMPGDRNSTASVDRRDNLEGYVKGNVAIISWRANKLKSDATILEIQALLNYMKGS